jgi:hypothetical protein
MIIIRYANIKRWTSGGILCATGQSGKSTVHIHTFTSVETICGYTMRKIQPGAWDRDALAWLLATHPDAPVLVPSAIRGKLQALHERGAHEALI